jgi:predicted subunit of tRNA(5-methylaminomethyl-2-thiouridylate) methyltransferase
LKDLTLYFLVPPSEIGYVGFIVHAYEGLAVVRTLDAERGLIEMLVSPDFEAELRALLKEMAKEVSLREVSSELLETWGIEERGGAP